MKAHALLKLTIGSMPTACAALLSGVTVVVSGQVPPASQGVEPSTPRLELPKDAGAGVTGAFEGWFANPDGSFTLLVGYMNRNAREALDIAVGPNNRIEPGGPDRGQPTHFLPRRQWGMFTIVVPKDFAATTRQLQWTLVANGQTAVVPLTLHPEYEVDPMRSPAGNTPPVLQFAKAGPKFQGPSKPLASGVARTATVGVGQALELPLFVTDDLHKEAGDELPGGRSAAAAAVAPVSARWSKFRGPGVVTFGAASPRVAFEGDGAATTTATFAAAGEYVLRIAGNDASGEGGGGFQCCWTSAFVRVVAK